MSEYLDVLDENGNMTGEKKLRELVHQDENWHRTVHVWIMNNAGEILLQRRCPSKDTYPNMLDISVGGHLTSGDTSIEGAIREVKEEVGLDIVEKDLKFITTIKDEELDNHGRKRNQFEDVYLLLKRAELQKLTYQQEEISEILFVSVEKLKDMTKNNQKDLLIREKEFEIVFKYIEENNLV